MHPVLHWSLLPSSKAYASLLKTCTDFHPSLSQNITSNMMSTVPLGESNANKAVKPPRRRGPKKQLGDVTKGSETTTSTPAPATPVEAVHVENVALEPPKLERNERESLKDLSK
jgi:hypothetical protein